MMRTFLFESISIFIVLSIFMFLQVLGNSYINYRYTSLVFHFIDSNCTYNFIAGNLRSKIICKRIGSMAVSGLNIVDALHIKASLRSLDWLPSRRAPLIEHLSKEGRHQKTGLLVQRFERARTGFYILVVKSSPIRFWQSVCRLKKPCAMFFNRNIIKSLLLWI